MLSISLLACKPACPRGAALRCAGHKNAVLEVQWTTDGERVLSASPDKSVRAWDAATGEQVKKMSEHDNFVNSCCPLRRGPPLLVSGSDDATAKVRAPLVCRHPSPFLLQTCWELALMKLLFWE